MHFTPINEISKSYLGSFYSQNIVAGKTNHISFQAVLDENMGEQGLEDMLEEVLKVKYPQLIYHVCDASKFTYWDRLDFPFSEVFKENMDENKLKNWRPVTPYATGYEEYVQRDRLSIPQGAYSVIIHPDVQKKMETDSAYAQKILDKIDKHFQDTIRINEAIDPGCTIGMKQAVYIDENGEIGHQVSITNGPDYDPGEKDNTIGEVYNKLPQNKKKVSNQKVVDNMVQNIVQNTTVHSSNYADLISFNGLGIIPYIMNNKKRL